MSSKLGDYIVEYRYRVDPIHRERMLELLAEVRLHVLDMGLNAFEVWTQEDDTWGFVELHGYDSWSHYQRVSQKASSPEMTRIYEAMDRLIEGGFATLEHRSWAPCRWPK